MFTLEALTEDMLVRILKEPKNAILKQYQKLLAMDEVRLEFEDDALMAIAKQAKEKKVGARALRAIIEDFMLDIMYEIPKDDNIGMVTITKEYVEKKGGPLIMMRGCAQIAAVEWDDERMILKWGKIFFTDWEKDFSSFWIWRIW